MGGNQLWWEMTLNAAFLTRRLACKKPAHHLRGSRSHKQLSVLKPYLLLANNLAVFDPHAATKVVANVVGWSPLWGSAESYRRRQQPGRALSAFPSHPRPPGSAAPAP